MLRSDLYSVKRNSGQLDGFAVLRKSGCEFLCYIPRLVLDKLPEPGGNVWPTFGFMIYAILRLHGG
jgi:hypothetical protein